MGLWQRVPSQWGQVLGPFRQVVESIDTQIVQSGGWDNVVPAADQVWRALEVSPDDIRVVLIGQDPYPNRNYACGWAFSIPPGVRPLPASMREIIAEVNSDTGHCHAVDGDLSGWVEQGVMLLNRSLTAAEGHPGSHSDWGWRPITQSVVQAVVRANPDVIGLLWGKDAAELTPEFRHSVVTSHPSPLSAHRGFRGSHCFSAVNQILLNCQMDPIRW